MSNHGWEAEDEVTTTFRSIQLAQQQAFEDGIAEGKREVLRWLTKERDNASRYYEDGLTYAVYKLEEEIMEQPEQSLERSIELAEKSLAEAKKTLEEVAAVLAHYARELREPNDD